MALGDYVPTTFNNGAPPARTAAFHTTQDAKIKELDDAAAAVVSALALKAPLANPALTGTPTAPTAPAGNNTTQLANTEFVKTAITAAGIVESGSNANGSYVKWGDGTMQQWGSVRRAVPVNVSSPLSITTATPFNATPLYYATLSDPSSNWAFRLLGIQNPTTSMFNAVIFNETIAQDLSINWQAIGRWKA